MGMNSFMKKLIGLLAFFAINSSCATIINVKVKVLSSPCIINNNQPIMVEFGDVITGGVNGERYRKKMNYTIVCPGNEQQKMTMRVTGEKASFDSEVFLNSVQDLGFRIKRDGLKVLPDVDFSFSYQALPEIMIIPVKREGARLPGGDFFASYTLTVGYE
ncbi:MAG: hypothetical protein FT714_12180 [Pantoea sp. Pent]|nr:hypothetical protein [Pantoea sp. Pent]